MMKTTYPKQIIPFARYHKELDIDALLKDFPSLTVVRQVKGSDVNDYIRASTDVVGLSMNLLGGRYKVNKHLPFLPKSDTAIKAWDGCDVSLKDYPSSSFTITLPCVGAYFKVSDIHNISFPFRKVFSSKSERDVFETRAAQRFTDLELPLEERLVGVFVKKGDPVDTFSVTKVKHAPVQLNYWHVTLEILPIGADNTLLASERSKNSVRSISKLIKMHLDKVMEITYILDYRLLRSHYINKMNRFDLLCDYIGV